jgi:hypothetical protein
MCPEHKAAGSWQTRHAVNAQPAAFMKQVRQ